VLRLLHFVVVKALIKTELLISAYTLSHTELPKNYIYVERDKPVLEYRRQVDVVKRVLMLGQCRKSLTSQECIFVLHANRSTAVGL